LTLASMGGRHNRVEHERLKDVGTQFAILAAVFGEEPHVEVVRDLGDSKDALGGLLSFPLLRKLPTVPRRVMVPPLSADTAIISLSILGSQSNSSATLRSSGASAIAKSSCGLAWCGGRCADGRSRGRLFESVTSLVVIRQPRIADALDPACSCPASRTPP
jgi:hypothetical protein